MKPLIDWLTGLSKFRVGDKHEPLKVIFMSGLSTPLDMLRYWESKFPDLVYLRQSTGTGWIEYDWKSVAKRVRTVATYIDNQNLSAGSSIVIWSKNSADWIIVDLAIMMSGHITVPIYPAQDIESVKYILRHCEAKMIIVGPCDYDEAICDFLPPDLHIITLQGARINGRTSFEQILKTTEPKSEFVSPKLDDVATIIYSSGTSGRPKGVMHTYRGISATGPLVAQTYNRPTYNQPGDHREHVISYLPLAHAAERSLVEITSLYVNACVSISAGLEFFPNEIRAVRPTFFGAVPRVWYKFREGIQRQFASFDATNATDEEKSEVRELLGLNDSRSNITGSAPVSTDVHKWFSEIGIPLSESYSMTETFSHGTFWSRNDPCPPGCVGQAAAGVEVILDDQNQILLKSATMMKGYFKNDALTSETLQNGWYNTGDLGRLDQDGKLWLTGRMGSVFKSSKGKFIHPERLEQAFKDDPWVEQVLVFGRGLPQPRAVISISETMHPRSDEDLENHFRTAVMSINSDLPAYEKIGAVLIVRDIWTTDGGVLTPTQKIKRSVVEDRYASCFPNNATDVLVA